MRMDEGLDTGPVLMAARVGIGRKTSGVLHHELALLGADLIGRALAGIERGSIQETPQSEDGATHARKIEKSETRIDWSKTADDLDCMIRGLSPAPGAWFEAKGERIKLLLAEPVGGKGMPGEVLADLTIACGEGALRPVMAQRAGRAPMEWQALLLGFPLQPGERLA
jgi:methionyl-tRNA formyltransferase